MAKQRMPSIVSLALGVGLVWAVKTLVRKSRML